MQFNRAAFELCSPTMVASVTESPFLFVTGASGHTGARTVARLLAEGWQLRCLIRNMEHRKFLPQDQRIKVIAGDIENADRTTPWIESLRGATAFLHLAHIGFASNVISACRATDVKRLVCLSSTRRFTKFPESTAQRVSEGEGALEASPLDYTILRPTMIYGGARDNNVERLVQWFRRHRAVPLVRGGRNLVQPVFVDDVVEAIHLALTHPSTTARRALTLAGPEPMTLRQMIEIVAEQMGVKPLWIPVPHAAAMLAAGCFEKLSFKPRITRDQVKRLLEDKSFDTTEAREALGGWSPRPFAEGIRLKLSGFYSE